MEIAEEAGINTGWVVAYGVLLKRPYLVEFRDDTVWINDVQYEPRKKNPAIKPKEVKPPSELYLQKVKLRREIEDTFNVYWKTYGWEEGHQMILDKYLDHPLISSLEYTESGKSVWITYSDGDRRNQGLREVIWEHYGPVSSPEDRMAVRRNEVNLVKSWLQGSSMLVFGHGGAVNVFPAEDAHRIMNIASQIKKGERATDDGKQQLIKIIDKPSAEEIMENLESW